MKNAVCFENARVPGHESPVKVAAIQFEPVLGDKQANLEKSLRLLCEAAENGADIAVMPELCSTGYVFDSRAEAYAMAEEVPAGPTTQAWMRLAKEKNMYIAAGIAEKVGVKLYNSSVLVGPEGYIGTHRKVCLWDEEKLFFEPGDLGNQVFYTPLGRMSMLICYDMWFPEQWRSCALKGADIVLVSTAWVKGSPVPFGAPSMGVFQGMCAALSNNFFVAVSDRIGTERGVVFPGGSLIIDKKGRPLAGPVGAEQTIVYAELNLGDARRKQWTGFANPLHNRREDLWGPFPGDEDYDAMLPK
ncbi:MAG: nitrilase family protein [Christensenellaceae bacterium]|nr:nitrilase family protein [Christensenellaceae bacterium]